MAERRMFSKTLMNADSFLELPLSTQCLYFHLSMSADDDGFIASAKRITRSIGAEATELQDLVDKGFLIEFPEANVYVDRFWLIHNQIRADRYHATIYQDQFKQLRLTESKAYELRQPGDNQVSATRQPDGTPVQASRGLSSSGQARPAQPSPCEMTGYQHDIGLADLNKYNMKGIGLLPPSALERSK